MHTTIKMNWAIQDLLPVAGSMVIFGKAGIGKSTFALRLGMSLALGKEKFLQWKIINRQKVLFVSLEMQHGELKQFFADMQIPEEEQQQLQEWFFVWPIGHAYPLDTPDQQIELLKYIDKYKIDLVIIDSHGLAMYGSVKDDDAVKRLNSFLNEDVRKERKCGYLFIHHPRKQGIDEGKKIMEQDDIYGSAYISFNAQTSLVLTQKPGTARLNVKELKNRMSQGAKDFDIERTPDRGFRLIDRTNTSSGETTTDKKPNAPIFGKLLDI
jgi:RecA-family ATPase